MNKIDISSIYNAACLIKDLIEDHIKLQEENKELRNQVEKFDKLMDQMISNHSDSIYSAIIEYEKLKANKGSIN